MHYSKFHVLTVILVLMTLILGCSSESNKITFNPSTLEFGEVYLDDIESETVVLKNKMGESVLITNVKITGSSAFIITSSYQLPIDLANNAEYSMTIAFEPISAEDYTSALEIECESTDKTFQLNITGTGKAVPRIAVTPTQYDFKKVLFNTSKDTVIKIENTGTADLTISSLYISGSGAPQFTLGTGSSTPFVVPTGQSHDVTVSFLPPTAAPYTADLNIEHDAVAENSPIVVTLDGEGVLTASEFTMNHTDPWNLGDCSMTFSSTQTLELTSNGLYDLNVNNVALQTSSEFTIKEILDNNGSPVSLPVLVPIGDKLSIVLEFSPTAKQIYNDVLTITHDATNHPQPLTLNISGTGVDVRTKTFTFTGATQTWTVPVGVTKALVLVVGGGGGGSGSHYGGGGSGYSIVKTVNVSGTITIEIGEGGTAGISGTNLSEGGDGKDTTFGTLVTALGGKGGGAYKYLYQTGGDGGSGGGGAGNMGSAGDGGSAGSNGLPGSTYAGGIGGHFDSLTPFSGNLTAGKGGAAGVSSHSGGGGAGGVLIGGMGPKAGDGGDTWSGKGGEGYGAGGGSGGFNSSTGTRPGGGKGADGVVYIEY